MTWRLLLRSGSAMLVMCALLILSACMSTVPYSVGGTSRCSAPPYQSTTCQITLMNKANSPVAFNWVASSTPAVVHFSQQAGTVAPGKQSTVAFTIPPGVRCPVKVDFTDPLTGAKVEYVARNTNTGNCI